MKPVVTAALAALLLLPALPALAANAAPARKDEAKNAKKKEPKELLSAGTFSGLALRSIGPAVTSGRIVDLAVHPRTRKTHLLRGGRRGRRVEDRQRRHHLRARSSTARAPTRSAA